MRVVKAFGQEQRELERLVGAAQGLYGSKLRAVRLQARYQPLLEAIPTFAQVAILALGGWLALQARHHDRHVPGVLQLRRAVRRAGPPARGRAHRRPAGPRRGRAHLPAARPAGRRSPTRPTPSSWRSRAASSPSTTCRFGYSDDDAGARRRRPARRGRRTGRARRAERQRQVHRSPRSRRASTTRRAGGCASTATTCATLTLASLRREVGFAFEDSFLFSDTVRANIAYGRPDAIRRRGRGGRARGRAARVHRRTADGYDTVVGERGLTLSGGQRQRIALARAILADPRSARPRRRDQRGRRADRGGDPRGAAHGCWPAAPRC